MDYKKEMSLGEAKIQFPFLENFEDLSPHNLRVKLTDYDQEFYSQGLVENESSALGHPSVHSQLYVVRSDKVIPVAMNRTPVHIYPPEYLHPGCEYPSDEYGESETISEALSRIDISGIRHVVVCRHGNTGYPKERFFNEMIIAEIP